MKKLIYSLIIVMLSCNISFAQSDVIETELQEIIEKKQDEKISVNIIFKKQINTKELESKNDNILDKKERRKAVVKELKEFSRKNQENVMSILRSEETKGQVAKIKSHWLSNTITCEISKELIYTLSQHEDILLIGSNQDKYVLMDEEPSSKSTTEAKADKIAENVTMVNADDVWEQGYTGKGVLVAVLDTGVNYEHADVKDHLWDGGEEYPYHGYNSYSDDINTMDDGGHGSHCAGTICGDGTSGTKTGIAPDATLMCIKAINGMGNSNSDAICTGMEFAVEHGADVLSMSVGIAKSSVSERTMIRQTCDNALAAGVIASVASGNEGNSQSSNPIPDNVRVPGSCPAPWIHPDQQVNAGGTSCVVSVGAVNYNDNIAGFSSRGPVTWANTSYADYPYIPEIGLIRPDVSAPGVDILSLDFSTNDDYGIKSGTSMAAPCVAGVMCLLLSKDQLLTPEDISMILETSSVKLTETKSNETGTGRIDALEAINAIDMGMMSLNDFSFTDENNNGKMNPGEEITINVNFNNTSSENLSNITAKLKCDNEWVNITNPNIELANIAANASFTIDNFTIELDENAESKTKLYFDIEFYEGNERISYSRFITTIYDSTIEFSSLIVEDDDNNNGILEAGETANIGVALNNSGNEIALELNAVLSSSSEYITVNSNEAFIEAIAPDGSATVFYNITLAGNAGDELNIPFHLEVEDKFEHANSYDMNYVGTCSIVYTLKDAFGDGWNGAKITAHYSDGSESDIYTITNGSSATYTKTLNTGVTVSLEWKKGGLDSECSYEIAYENGVEIFKGEGTQSGTFFSWDYNCSCQNMMFENCESVQDFLISVYNDKLELSWNAPQSEGVVSYEIYRNTELVATTEETSFLEENLTDGTYTYNVRPVYEDCYGALVGDEIEFHLSTDEMKNIKAAVYPNPSKDIFTVRCEDMTNIKVFNILGEMILDIKTLNDSHEITDLKKGVYFINIESEKGSVVKKVVRY